MTTHQDLQWVLQQSGLPGADVTRWLAQSPEFDHADTAATLIPTGHTESLQHFVRAGQAFLYQLPAKPQRTAAEQLAAELLLTRMRSVRAAYLQAHAPLIYRSLTCDYSEFLRVDELVYVAADRYPGLLPTRTEIATELARQHKDKEGLEIDQGLFLSSILADPRAGAHLVHAMQRPKRESQEYLDVFRRSGALDLGTVRVHRTGHVTCITICNPAFLNAEDDTTLGPLETALDVVLLDEQSEVGVLRGSIVDHPRYRGRRVFSAGLNLTHLYRGDLSFLYFITRELGPLNKIYRGLADPVFRLAHLEATHEKPWIAAVDSFAIGGGCQLLLIMDYVIAAEGSYFRLPARREGIIPGVANLRLPRLVGGRLARKAILFDERIDASSTTGQMLCDQVVPPAEIDAAIDAVAAELTGRGHVSMSANRKALRVGQEPLEQFLKYMSFFAREQAYSYFDPALIRNLEAHWINRSARKGQSAPVAL